MGASSVPPDVEEALKPPRGYQPKASATPSALSRLKSAAGRAVRGYANVMTGGAPTALGKAQRDIRNMNYMHEDDGK